MRYEIDDKNYIVNVYFGCYGTECIEYTGDIPENYETLTLWAENENINAWKIVDGNLVFDANKAAELELKCELENRQNKPATQKYVDDKIKVSSNYVSDELSVEKIGGSLITIEDTGNYNIPELKVTNDVIESFRVISSNKNVLGIETISTTINGVEITNNGDGTITLNGTSTDEIKVDLNGSDTNIEMCYLIGENLKYSISGLTANVSLSLYSYNGIDRTLVISGGNQSITLNNSYRITQTTLYVPSGMSFNNTVIKPQIEIGNTTSFVKHEQTDAIGIMYENECTIYDLNSYEEKTIIMIDKEVTASVKYYKYQYLNEKLAEISVTEEEVRSTLKEIDETVEGQNQKISEVSQRVGELNSKISEIADITISGESLSGNVTLNGINEGEPIYIKIHPTVENISYLYPKDTLFPSDNLFPKTRKLQFTNTETWEIVDYELPCDLLYYDEENYDEFILDYELQTCTVNKRVGINTNGITYLLETPRIIEYEYPRIPLTSGNYAVFLYSFRKAYLFVRMMAQNIYTTQFATKAEVKSEITQTSDSITSEVSKKVGKNEVISSINQTAEAISINANKININGVVSANNNFKVDTNGNMTCNNGTFNGGNVNLVDNGLGVYEGKLKVQGDSFINGIYSEGMVIRKVGNATNYITPSSIFINMNKSTGEPQIRLTTEDRGLLTVDSSLFGYMHTPDRGFSVGEEANFYGISRMWVDGGITTPNVTQTSKKENKKNFEKFENALDIIKNIDIYKYNLKTEKDNTKKHLGFVIGDDYKYAEEVTSTDNDGVDVYSFVSLCCKAIKEQQILIDDLKKEIKSLKKGEN